MSGNSTAEQNENTTAAAEPAAYQAIAHKGGDHVAVAVQDLKPGDDIQVYFLEGTQGVTLTVTENVVLGHKLALRDLSAGDKVIEYGQVIGKTVSAIPKGGHVHVHNLKSVRWSRS